MNPKAFISHASEDKDRFVLGFATRLREHGVDAWVDRWEILPGDSLVQRIFEEGLRQADAVVVVLSANSVDKPWVRRELDVGVVEQISQGRRLIPVVLDDCIVPEALNATLWTRIADLQSYDAELESIVRAIFEVREKPPLGRPPAYATREAARIDGLSREDSLVLRALCEAAIEAGASLLVS